MDFYENWKVIIDSEIKFYAYINAIREKAGTMINNLLQSIVCRSEDFS